MTPLKLALALLVVTSLSTAVTAIAADAPFEITSTLDASGFKLTWRVEPHAPKLCTLEKKALKAQMSFDRSAVIFAKEFPGWPTSAFRSRIPRT